MDTGNLLSSSQVSILEGITSNLHGLLSGNYLQGLEYTWIDLMLDSSVLSLEIISNNHKINILVSFIDIWVVLNMNNLNIKSKMLVESKILNIVASLDSDITSKDGLVLSHSLEMLRVLHREILNDIELNRTLDGIEDLYNRL